MAKFKIHNLKRPADWPLQDVVMGDDSPTFQRLVLLATGNGVSEKCTRNAMLLNQKLLSLRAGEVHRVAGHFMNDRLQQFEVDLSFTRLGD